MGLYLDGAAWADWAGGLHDYIAGDPDEIEVRTVVLWDPNAEVALGDPIPLIVDEVTRDLEATGAGALADEERVIYTKRPLEEGRVYRYLERNYTAEEIERDETNTPDATFPCRTVLRIHAS